MNLEQLANYLVTFALVSLAVYRMSIMVAMEYGPWDVFERLRHALPRGSMVSKLVSCPFCLSFWFGLAGSCVLPYYNAVWFVVTSLALSAVATMWVKRYG